MKFSLAMLDQSHAGLLELRRGAVLVIICRLLPELVILSDQHASATDAADKMCLLAAGEVLSTQ